MQVSTYKNSRFLEKYGRKVVAHRLVPFRKIMELLSPLKGKKILDVGCGSGELDELMVKRGANVIGLDRAEKWISRCAKTYHLSGLSFVCVDAAKKLPFRAAEFDAVVMNMVLLNVATLSEVRAIIREVGRVTKKGGTFIFSDLHPICIMTPKVPPRRYQKYSAGFSYFKDGAEYVAGVVLDGKEKIEFQNKHWTLETYSSILEKAGFSIYKLSEPTYGKDAPALLRQYKIPEYLLICCRKR
jgi:ubiquinone/menaquinone biosynthesis C-methylase UbiE